MARVTAGVTFNPIFYLTHQKKAEWHAVLAEHSIRCVIVACPSQWSLAPTYLCEEAAGGCDIKLSSLSMQADDADSGVCTSWHIQTLTEITYAYQLKKYLSLANHRLNQHLA